MELDALEENVIIYNETKQLKDLSYGILRSSREVMQKYNSKVRN